MAGIDYKVNLRDIFFVLFEQLDVDALDDPRFAEFDQDLYETILSEAAKMAETTIAPLNGPGDRQGCRFNDGAVRTPDGYKAAYDAFVQAGWNGLATPMDFGGQGLPHSVALSVVEQFTGACPAFNMYPGLTAAAANLVRERGDAFLQQTYLDKLVSGEWAGTMCLTEAQAGSAVGDVRTVARKVDGADHYLLEGSKIFVSGGEHDLTDNIVHLMLARTPDAPSGIKGLSLFVVPKFVPNADGSLGERNDVLCTGIEHKMGINGSSTCSLSLGEAGGAKGWIVGDEGEGIQHMFLMMNEARIGVGVQGLAVASAATHAAIEYARERIQGTSLQNLKDADAPRVAIIEHPDVKRMLLWCRSQVEGMRALAYSLAYWSDLAHDGTNPDARKYRAMAEVLTPICKAWCTDQAFDVAKTALQVFGGYGYIGEYPVEQFVRDAKIFSIYEGTNGIQALDLVGRKMRMKGGAAFMEVLNHINLGLEQLGTHEQFAAEKAGLEKARDRVGDAAMHLGMIGMQGEVELPAMHAVDMLMLFGDLVIGHFLGEAARVALPLLEARAAEKGVDLRDREALNAWIAEDDEGRFLQGKLDNLRFYVHQFLPRTAGWHRAVKSMDKSALEAVF